MTIVEPVGMERECLYCRFFSQTGEPEEWGECRRHSPVAAMTLMMVAGDKMRAEDVSARWPQVAGQDWCGDFEIAYRTKAA